VSPSAASVTMRVVRILVVKNAAIVRILESKFVQTYVNWEIENKTTLLYLKCEQMHMVR
jgi:hypothetical protein